MSGCTPKEEEDSVSQYVASPGSVPSVVFEVRRAQQQPDENLEEAIVKSSRKKVYLHPEVLLTNKDIRKTGVEMFHRGKGKKLPRIDIILTDEGFDKLGKIGKTNVNNQIAILLDGKVVSCQTVGQLGLTGVFHTRERAEIAAKRLVGQ